MAVAQSRKIRVQGQMALTERDFSVLRLLSKSEVCDWDHSTKKSLWR
jgi:hypothetical protein